MKYFFITYNLVSLNGGVEFRNVVYSHDERADALRAWENKLQQWYIEDLKVYFVDLGKLSVLDITNKYEEIKNAI
jgi:hypothetical protein